MLGPEVKLSSCRWLFSIDIKMLLWQHTLMCFNHYHDEFIWTICPVFMCRNRLLWNKPLLGTSKIRVAVKGQTMLMSSENALPKKGSHKIGHHALYRSKLETKLIFVGRQTAKETHTAILQCFWLFNSESQKSG